MKKIAWLFVALVMIVSLVASVFSCTQPAPAPAPPPAPAPAPTPAPAPAPKGPEPVELTMWSAWPKDVLLTTDPYIDMLLEAIKEKGGAVKLSMEYIGGPEIFPNTEGLEAVSKGLVDIGWTSPWYYRGTIPEATLMTYSQITPWEERETGAYDLLNKWHQEKSNTMLWMRQPSRGTEGSYRIYLGVERTEPDLTGLKLRSAGLYDYIIKPLGGSAVSVAPPEIYSAMQRGLVDGYGWSAAGIRTYKLEEVTKYLWGPLIFNSADSVIMNLDKWNSLHGEQQAFMIDLAKQMERDIDKKFVALFAEEVKLLADLGVKEQRWDAETEKWYKQLAVDTAWEDQMEKMPEYAAEFKRLSTK